MEKIYEESEGKPEAKPAHEVMRTNPDVKAALAPWRFHVGSLVKTPGKILGKSWENHGKIMGKSWENHVLSR